MPKPSVPLWSAKPMISTSARLVSPRAADCPMARPSAKLCRPMPVAIRTASQLALDIPCIHDGSNSAAEAAPGPSRLLARSRAIQRS